MDKKTKAIIAPSYLQAFSCIGGSCEDTCCAGWTITLDESTYKKYKKVKDAKMKVRLNKEVVARKGVTSEEYVAKIKLKNGRCAFLNGKGWCDIYTELGASYLCHSCTLYPRTINRVNEGLEYSLTFSCPEATRRILFNPEGIKFEKIDKPFNIHTISADLQLDSRGNRWKDYLLELREWMLELIQDRRYPLEVRIQLLEEEVRALEHFITQGNTKKIPSFLSDLKAKRIQPANVVSLNSIETISKEAIELAQYLKQINKEKKMPSKRYLECLKEALEGLRCDETGKGNLEEKQQIFEEGYKKYYQEFLAEQGYILENYLVNYIFERCIPLDGQIPLESFERMNLYYRLIRMHLIGIACKHEQITDELIVKLIQSFSKVFDHHEEYIKGILENLR